MNAPVRLPLDDTPRRPRFTIEQFEAIERSGALDGYAKTELLDGEIFVVNAQAVWHMRAKREILFALEASLRAIGSNLETGVEGSVAFEPGSLPEPDVFVWEPADPSAKWVPGDSVRLVVEVADTSERHDLDEKRRLYAAYGVPEYWVVARSSRAVERFASPLSGDYDHHDRVSFTDPCASLSLAGVAVPAGILSAMPE